MAGGKGSRMKVNEEKLLLKYKKSLIFHVLDALENSGCFSEIIALTSKNLPKTRQKLIESDVPIFDTAGKDYVKELNEYLKTTKESVFVTSGDLPLLDYEIVQDIVRRYNPEDIWKSFVVTKDFLLSLELDSSFQIKVENQDCSYTGISLVNARSIQDIESVTVVYEILNDKRIAFNINTENDYNLLCSS